MAKGLNGGVPVFEPQQGTKQVNVNSIITHFQNTYESKNTKLEGWQTLCRDVGVPAGSSISQCKKAMKGVFVNIWDFVKDKRANQPIRRFGSAGALRGYTHATGKFFPLRKAKQDTVLRALLINMY